MIIMAVITACIVTILCVPLFKYKQQSYGPFVVLVLAGIAAIALYGYAGNPTVKSAPFAAIGSTEKETYRKLLLEEYALSAALAKNPKDIETLIKLVALRIAQGRDSGKTTLYLAQAKDLAPKDQRIQKLEKLLEMINQANTENAAP